MVERLTTPEDGGETNSVEYRPMGEAMYRTTRITNAEGELTRVRLERIKPRVPHEGRPSELPIS